MYRHAFAGKTALLLLCGAILLQTGCASARRTAGGTSSGASNFASSGYLSTSDSSTSNVSDTSTASGGTASSGSKAGAGGKTGANNTNGTANGVDIWKKYSPEITVKMGRSTDDTVESVLSQLGETIGNNRWITLYKEKLGINIKYDWVVKGVDGYATKLNLSISSNQLPEMCSVTPVQINQLAAAGLIQDLTDVYNKYASDLTKQTLNNAGTDIFKPSTINGKLMGLPNTIDPSVDAPMLWIRKDWLDNLNLSLPKTMDDLDRIVEAFTKNDPDKNGKNDTYGFTSYKGLWGTICGLDGFFAGFNSFPKIWGDKNGSLVYGAVQPEAKSALDRLNKYYKNGYMPVDFGVYDGGAVAELITSGKVGIEYGSHWNSVYPLNLSKEKDSKANWVAVALPSATGQTTKSIFTTACSSWFVVKKGYANPEALVKLFNLFIETNWGQSQQWNKYFLDGSTEGVWKLSPVFPSVTNQNITDYKQLEQARGTNDYSNLGPSAKGIQTRLQSNDWGWKAVYGSGGSMGILANYSDNNLYVKDKFIGAPTPTMVSKLSTLTTMQNEIYVKIIMGSAPLSDFDAFVSNWSRAGGEQMTKEANEWYKANK